MSKTILAHRMHLLRRNSGLQISFEIEIVKRPNKIKSSDLQLASKNENYIFNKHISNIKLRVMWVASNYFWLKYELE